MSFFNKKSISNVKCELNCIEYKFTRKDEKILVDVYKDGTYEVLNIRSYPNSDLIDIAIKIINKKHGINLKQR